MSDLGIQNEFKVSVIIKEKAGSRESSFCLTCVYSSTRGFLCLRFGRKIHQTKGHKRFASLKILRGSIPVNNVAIRVNLLTRVIWWCLFSKSLSMGLCR